PPGGSGSTSTDLNILFESEPSGSPFVLPVTCPSCFLEPNSPLGTEVPCPVPFKVIRAGVFFSSCSSSWLATSSVTFSSGTTSGSGKRTKSSEGKSCAICCGSSSSSWKISSSSSSSSSTSGISKSSSVTSVTSSTSGCSCLGNI